MHAVVIHVTINDPEQATEALRSEVVPQVSAAPGFVAGYWVSIGENQGVALVAFESEDAARAAADRAQAPGGYVTFDSVDVGEVVASA
jgi:hypothetical protein